MKLSLVKLNTQLWQISLFDEGGEPLDVIKGYMNEKRKKEIAKLAGVPESDVRKWVAALEVQNATADFKPSGEWDVPGMPPPPVVVVPVKPSPTVVIRPVVHLTGIEPIVVTAETWGDAYRQALAITDIPFANPRIEWDGVDEFACVDVDYTYPPDPSQLAAIVGAISPQPMIWHPSHGGGMKLFYRAMNSFSAEQLATLAAIRVQWEDAAAKCEVKRDTRHPFYPRTDDKPAEAVDRELLFTQTQTDDIPSIASFFVSESIDTGAVAAARDEYLAVRNWKIKGRADHGHTQCPITPNLPTTSANPLHIGDVAIFCHYCQSKGYAAPGELPGVWHYSQLLNTRAPARAKLLVKNLVHWTQAKYVLRAGMKDRNRMPDSRLKIAYQTALQVTHGVDDPRVVAAMTKMDGIIRSSGHIWTSEDGRIDYAKSAVNTVKGLPAVRYVATKPDGTLEDKPDVELVDKFLTPGWELDKHGYSELHPIQGHRIWAQHNDYFDHKIRYSVQPPYMKHLPAPKYLPKSVRTPEKIEAAWQEIEKVFPGVNRNYTMLVLVTSGYAEAWAIQSPMILAHGTAGSGKSTIPQLACGIMGADFAEMGWLADRQRMTQGIRSCAMTGRVVVFNEIFKDAEAQKTGPRQALDFALNTTPESQSHVLYQGSSPLGKNPAMIFTDTILPEEVANDAQISRRCVQVSLMKKMVWAPTMKAAGITRARDIRSIGQDMAAACDVILSEACDLLAITGGGEIPLYGDVVKSLGFDYIQTSADQSSDALIRHFYELVVAAPPLGEAAAKKYGKRWKRIKPGDASDLSMAWEDVADRGNMRGARSSRMLHSADLSAVLGLHEGVRFDSKSADGSVFVKFFSGGVKFHDWCNGVFIHNDEDVPHVPQQILTMPTVSG